MELLGSGIDIVELQRIRDICERRGSRFAAKLLHPKEMQEMEEAGNQISFIAKRFAVKEAAAKALGIGIGKELGFKDMFVEHDSLGKPILVFTGSCVERLGLQDKHNLLTIADERSYAVAHVIFFKK